VPLPCPETSLTGSGDPAPFRTALERYYDGERDMNTLELLD
jgi:uncharacterized protein (DUF1810 family)